MHTFSFYKRVRLCLLAALLLLTGCAGKQPPAGTVETTVPTTEPAVESTAAPAEPGASGGEAFESVLLTGEAVDQTVFADYALTMINVWATYCGPCKSEMPELERLYGMLPENVNLVSICVYGEQDRDLTQEVADACGVTYPVILGSESLYNGMLRDVQVVPTTIFVDSGGNVVGDWILGVPYGDVANAYLSAIRERLELLG